MQKHARIILLQIIGLVTLGGAAMFACAQTPVPKASSAEPAASGSPSADDAGYAYGVNFGEQLFRLGIANEIPVDALLRGLKDGMAGKRTTGKDLTLTSQFVQSVLDASLARNRAAAKEFLSRNVKVKGVKATASGLQYKIIAAGSAKGAAPRPTDRVTVQYRGTLIDGTEFDSSYARGEPATFLISGVIKGWQEALPMMKPGAKWQLFVPPELAYDATRRPSIPAGSLLIFELELMSFEPTTEPTEQR